MQAGMGKITETALIRNRAGGRRARISRRGGEAALRVLAGTQRNILWCTLRWMKKPSKIKYGKASKKRRDSSRKLSTLYSPKRLSNTLSKPSIIKTDKGVGQDKLNHRCLFRKIKSNHQI